MSQITIVALVIFAITYLLMMIFQKIRPYIVGVSALIFVALGTIRNLLTPVPPLALQQEFADKIEAIEKQKELIKQSITQTETLFNARMDYYFN